MAGTEQMGAGPSEDKALEEGDKTAPLHPKGEGKAGTLRGEANAPSPRGDAAPPGEKHLKGRGERQLKRGDMPPEGHKLMFISLPNDSHREYGSILKVPEKNVHFCTPNRQTE